MAEQNNNAASITTTRPNQALLLIHETNQEFSGISVLIRKSL